MAEILTGGCLCGAVRYRAEAARTIHYVCHCTDCQRFGGGAWHAAIVVAAGELAVQGGPRVWSQTADSGRTIARHFCGTCGGHLFTSPVPATRYSVKAGTLDDPALFRPAHEIWCRSKLPWAHLPGPLDGHAQGFATPVDIGAATAGKEPIG